MKVPGFAVILRRIAVLSAVVMSVFAQPVSGGSAVDRARGFFADGEIRAAVIELKNVLQTDPGDIDARLLLGKIYVEMRLGAAAEKEILRAVELGAPAAEWRLDLAHALILQNKFSDALDRLEGAADVPEGNASRLLALRGIALGGLGRTDEADTAFNEALVIDPANEQAEFGRIALVANEGDLETAIAMTDALLERAPEYVDALLLRGGLYRKEKDLQNAADMFSRVLAVDPKNLRALLGRATAGVGRNDIEAALADLDTVDAIRKDIPMTLYLRGVVEFQKNNWEAARDYMQKVLAVQPGHVQSMLIYGIVSYSQGDYEIADEYLNNVVRAMPENVQARKVLGANRIKMREPERAIDVLRPAADTGDSQIMALLGSAHVLNGDQELGQQWLSRAVAAAPDVAALRTQLALTMLAGGQTGEAIDELKSAVDLGQDILQADVLLVLAHLKKGEFDQALAASHALEERMPDNPIAYNLTGLALMAKGDREQAAARFGKALEIDPRFVSAEINLARLESTNDELEAAETHYKNVLQVNPKHLGAMLGLAALAERRGESAEMVALLEQAQVAVDSAQPGLLLVRYYIRERDYENALATADKLAARYPRDEAVQQMLGRAQTLAGEIDKAIVTFQRSLAAAPESPQLHYLLGGAQWKAKDLPAARRSFRTAFELRPDFADARVALASVYLDSGLPDDALAVARNMQQDFPDSPLGYRVEGTIHQRQRQFADAVSAFEKAFARKRSAAAARALAQSYAQDNRLDEAIETLQHWDSEHKGDRQVMAALAMLYQTAGRNSDALKLYEELNAAGQANPFLVNNMAWLLHEMGDKRALELARQAYDAVPDRPEIADTYGWILYNTGRKEEGLSILQQAYLAFPSQTEIGYHTAVVLDAVGRKDEAANILRRLLRTDDPFETRGDAEALLKKLGG